VNRDAGAVLLWRQGDRGPEVYLAERAPALRFFGGYLAVPGGVRSEVDRDAPGAGDDDAQLSFCAVRELFEETGVLLLDRPELDGQARQALRTALLADDGSGWAQLLRGRQDLSALAPACRIRTPRFSPVRYDTLFSVAELPAGETPEIWPGELISGRFWRPDEALSAWRRGEILIVPPVIILFELLAQHGMPRFCREAAAIAASYAAGALHRVRFSPGVIMAALETPTLPPATTTNCLIVGERELYIIDPATPDAGEQQRLFALLDDLRAEGRELRAVLLTHHHPDHVGAVRAVADRYQLPVRGHERTLDRLTDIDSPGPAIEDGERIALGTAPDGAPGWHLQALFTPGHARGHLCYRESRYLAVIAGDMMSTVSTIVIDPPEGHMRTYLQSLERLAGEPMATMYPAHGPAARDGHKVVAHYLRHRRERQDKLIAALRERRTATADELLPEVYDDVDPRLLPVAARSLLAGLEMATEDGTAQRSGEIWRYAGDD